MKLRRILKRVDAAVPGYVGRWVRRGRPAPPPHSIKVRNLLVLADIFDIKVLVETGTFKGDMIAATLDRFDRIYSIELDPRLARAATHRFRAFGKKVQIIEGDSAKMLPEVIRNLPDKALFWLDGHYSGPSTGKGDVDTPILAEIDVIAGQRAGADDVVIVDDARLFGRAPAYPRLDDFVGLLHDRLGGQIRVADDSIFRLPLPRPG